MIVGSKEAWYPRYDPQVISDSPAPACDSAGLFWTFKHHDGARDINRVADFELNSVTIARISVLVNGGGNGFYERQAFGMVAAEYLGDVVSNGLEINIAPQNKSISIVVNLENAME